MRMLHTSDWHIGRQFHNVSLLEDQEYVLDQIIDIVRDKDVDVLLLAGDIYDRSVPSAEAVTLLDEVIHRISQELSTPMIMMAGNHDSHDRLAFGARQFAQSGVHITGPLTAKLAPLILSDEYGEVAFFSLPYADPATVRHVFKNEEVHSHAAAMQVLTDAVRQQLQPDQRSVVLSHCFVHGGKASDSERPLSVGGAETVPAALFADFDYVALGHLHGPQKSGKQQIRYAGSILKYSFSEAKHKKSVTLIDMDAEGAIEIEEIPLKPKRDMRILEGEMDKILAAAKKDKRREDYVLVRLTDTGAILDASGKIRNVYPNVLHLEKRRQHSNEDQQANNKPKLERGPMPMFRDFYKEVTGERLPRASAKLVVDLLDRIRHQEDA